MELFGFEIAQTLEKGKKGFSIKRKGGSTPEDKKEPKEELTSFVPPNKEAGEMLVSSGGYFGHFLDIDGANNVTSERDLIMRYRMAAAQPECDNAISDICDSAIVSSDDSAPVNLIMDDLDYPENIKKKINAEFEEVVKVLNFNRDGTDIFRRWYVDGRLYYHVIVDPDRPKDGIKEVRQVDPCRIKKIREVETTTDRQTMVQTVRTVAEYFLYSENPSVTTVQGIRINKDAIVYTPSGLTDESRKIVTSHLHKALKLANQLRMLEDSLVIYRISRAPERRIFYIDVGNLPKTKSEEYVQGIMSKYRNKLVYDIETGEVKDDRKSMSMLEDFWLPRREGGRGTEITTLPGGENLGQIEDVIFFQKKLYKALNVPTARLEGDNPFNVGRSTEISREEVRFQKFIDRLRKRFSYLLLDMLRLQLLLKGIITEDDWSEMKEDLTVDYVEDNYFSQLKEFEILRERLTMLESIENYIGTYYSKAWVRHNILRQTDEDVERIADEIAEEEAEEPEEDDSGFPADGEEDDEEGGASPVAPDAPGTHIHVHTGGEEGTPPPKKPAAKKAAKKVAKTKE